MYRGRDRCHSLQVNIKVHHCTRGNDSHHCCFNSSSITDKSKNRGFAFVEYRSHRAATIARRKCIRDRLQLWGRVVAVDWAEPEPIVGEEILSKVLRPLMVIAAIYGINLKRLTSLCVVIMSCCVISVQ